MRSVSSTAPAERSATESRAGSSSKGLPRPPVTSAIPSRRASCSTAIGWTRATSAYVAGGEVYITGRVKDLIIRGGRNIYPYDLEQAVGAIPGIRKGCVAVFGSTDAASGTERVVVLAETTQTDEQARDRLVREINAAALDVLGMPADDVVLAPPHTVLKTSSGKIRRAASREYYERRGLHVRPAPVWLQFVHLAIGAVLPELRRSVRGVAALLYAVYAWAVMVLVTTPMWIIVRMRSASTARALHLSLRGQTGVQAHRDSHRHYRS